MPSVPVSATARKLERRAIVDVELEVHSVRGFGQVVGGQLRLGRYGLRKMNLEGLGNITVVLPSLASEQQIVGRVLHQSVLEAVGSLNWKTVPENQFCGDETIERLSQPRLR